MDLLGGVSFRRLESALDAASLRQRVIANNIANNDTPYFKRSDVVFEELLSQKLGDSNGTRSSLPGRVTHAKHIPINGAFAAVPQARVVTDESTSINNNRNNVDIDKEMSLLAENQLRYNLFVQQISHEVRMLRTGIEGR